jgi:hypothetical protein
MPIRDAEVASRVLGKTVEAFAERLSSISFQKASSHSGGAVFLMVRVVISFCSCIRVVILLLLNIGRLAPSTPNMGWIGHGRNYVRSNKKVGRRRLA